MSENKFDIMQFTEILKDTNFSDDISIKDIKLNDKDYLNKKFGIKRYLFNNILDSIETINFAFSSKIDFDYEVKKIYKEKFYDSLEDLLLKIDNILEQRIYQSKDEYNKIIKYYDENNSIIKLTFELYKFILQHAKPN